MIRDLSFENNCSSLKVKTTFYLCLIHFVFVTINEIVFNTGFTPDSITYLKTAKNYLHFDFFQIEDNWKSAPGYPVFLAFFTLWGKLSWALVVFAQCLIHFFSLRYLLNIIYEKYDFINGKALYVFLILFTIYPNFLFIQGGVMSESIYSSIILVLFGLLIRLKDIINAKDLWLLSLIYGLGMFFRFEIMLIVIFPSILFLCYYHFKKIFKMILILPVFSVLFLSLNALKNQQIFGVFYPFGFGSSSTMYGGANITFDGSWHTHNLNNYKKYIPKEFHEEYVQVFDRGLSSDFILEQKAFFSELVSYMWENHSIEIIKTIPIKFFKLWLLPNPLDIYTSDFNYTQGTQFLTFFDFDRWPWYGPFKHAFYIGLHWLLLILIVISILKCIKDKVLIYETLFIILVALIFTSVFCLMFYGFPRFNSSYMPLFSIPIIYIIHKSLEKVNL